MPAQRQGAVHPSAARGRRRGHALKAAADSGVARPGPVDVVPAGVTGVTLPVDAGFPNKK